MSDIYICGHGGWDTIGRSSGFVNLPASTSFVLYEEIGHPMYVSDALEILSRNPGAKAPVRRIGAFKAAPDMTIFPAPEFEGQFVAASSAGGSRAFVVSSPTSLARVLGRFRGHTIHWIACSNRMLNKS